MKTDRYRLERIAEMGNQLLDVVDDLGITEAALSNDYRLQWLVTTPLFNIGEQVNCLSPDLIARYPDVPWVSVAGLRHRLVHNYEGTNWSMIARIILEDVRPLVESVQAILSELHDDAG